MRLVAFCKPRIYHIMMSCIMPVMMYGDDVISMLFRFIHFMHVIFVTNSNCRYMRGTGHSLSPSDQIGIPFSSVQYNYIHD